MFELQWVKNEITGERRLFYRTASAYMDASGALNVSRSEWSPWQKVPEITLDEMALGDLIASGGIRGAP